MVKLKLNVLEDLEMIQLSPNHPKHMVKIGTRMDFQIKYAIIDFLKLHQGMFTLSINDMVTNNPEVITTSLN